MTQDPGARWLRCDLHVHTPFDQGRTFGEDLVGAIEAFKRERPARLAAIAERLIGYCRAAADGQGIDLVALTDHNSIEGYRVLHPCFGSIEQQARAQNVPMPVILPGVEFSVGGERPLHFIVIFAAETRPEDIDGAIRYVFGERTPFDPQSGTPRATGESINTFLERLYRYCRPSTGERHLRFVLLPAHAETHRGVARETGATDPPVTPTLWEEMKGHLRQWAVSRIDWNGFETSSAFDHVPRAFQDLLLRWIAARRGEDWDALTDTRRDRYRQQKHWPLVECSDPHSYEDVGRRFTWLKMELADVEGIRLALLDPESRLRRRVDGPPACNYPQLKSIRITQTDFFEDIYIPFSPSLTTLIGGHGSGKSTVIEYLRYVLDRARADEFKKDEEEIRTAVEDLLRDKRVRDYGETKGTLLPNHRVEVELTVAGRLYRISRDREGFRVIPDPNAPGARHAPLDVRTLVEPRILSQRQIARIARDSAAQRRELDALIPGEQLQEFEVKRREGIEELTALQISRRQLKDRAKGLTVRETDLQKVTDQIAFLERRERRETLERFSAYRREQEWLDEVQQEIGAVAEGIERQAGQMGSAATRVGDPPSGPTHEWTNSVKDRLGKRLHQVEEAFHEQGTLLREFLQTIGVEKRERWLPRFTEAQRDYTELRRQLEERGVEFAQHEQLLQRRALLEREVRELQGLSAAIEETEQAIRQARDRLVQLHAERFNLRLSRAQALEEINADVRLTIRPFMDRDDLNSRREEWFAGAGLQERDWDLLMEYVYASNGSSPDRFYALINSVRKDVESTKAAGKVLDITTALVVGLLGPDRAPRLTGHFFNSLQRGDRIRLDEMERFLPEDGVEARVRGADSNFKPISQGSIGQRSTAILSLLLSSGDQPLIMDQPEDDLDNQYIYDVVVDLLRKRKFGRQIIMVAHNANIPVNGDAELIVALGVKEDELLGAVIEMGSIDSPRVKDQVSVIMEGSVEAFRLRRERYGIQ